MPWLKCRRAPGAEPSDDIIIRNRCFARFNRCPAAIEFGNLIGRQRFLRGRKLRHFCDKLRNRQPLFCRSRFKGEGCPFVNLNEAFWSVHLRIRSIPETLHSLRAWVQEARSAYPPSLHPAFDLPGTPSRVRSNPARRRSSSSKICDDQGPLGPVTQLHQIGRQRFISKQDQQATVKQSAPAPLPVLRAGARSLLDFDLTQLHVHIANLRSIIQKAPQLP